MMRVFLVSSSSALVSAFSKTVLDVLPYDRDSFHGSLGLGKLGGGNDFHRFRDFLDIADGFETAFDLSQRSIIGRGYRDRATESHVSI